MEDTKETLKKELKKLAGIILQDVKKTVSHLEGLIKNSRWDFKKYPTIEDCYFEEIASSLNPIETYAAILEKIDTYCVALGLSPFRFSFLTLGGFRFIADVFSDQGNIPSTNLILSSPRLVIEAVSNVYGNFLLVGSKLFKPQEVEEIFSRKISDQLIDYNKEIDSLGHKTPGAGEGDKQSGQLAIIQKEKTEHPLIAKYNEYIKTVWEYVDTLYIYSENNRLIYTGKEKEIYRANPKDVRLRTDIKDDRFPGLIYVELRSGKVVGLLPHSHKVFMEGRLLPPEETFNKLQSLSSGVQKIYRSLQPDLGLDYDWRHLGGDCMDFKDKDGSLWDKLRTIARKLTELRDRTQWKLEKETLTAQEKEPPGAGGEDKPAHRWRLAVKGTGQKEETTQNPKPSLIPSYLDSPIAKIIGLLAAFVTLIMFVCWLFARQ